MALGGPINTGTHPSLLWPGIHATWGQVYNEHAKEYVDLYEQLDSDKAYEKDVEVTGFGIAPIKPEGEGIAFDSELQGIITTYQHIAYASGYIVTYEEMRDNQYEEVSTRRAKANAFSINQTIEQVAAFLYNNAFVSTYFTTGDGVALLSSAHVNAAGGTYSNILSPAADLSEAALEDLTIQIMGVQNDRGLNISVMPKSLHVARQEIYNATRILKSVLQSGGSNNDVNALAALRVFPDGAKVNHYFTAPHAWFIRTNVMNGMQMFWRDRPDLANENDFDTKNHKVASYMRFSVGCTDPRGIFGSNGP
jgi:hypothetical protein